MSALSPGVYVHFAYCARRCVYCDFALATPRNIPAVAYTDALLAELELRLGRREDPRGVARVASGAREASTFYVGGGTPSLWPRAELGRFLARLNGLLPLAAGAEVTLEANPEEVSAAMLDELHALGVNRLSLGVQSLDPAELDALSRGHGRAGAEAALGALAEAYARGRLRSFSVDLMYGLPGQTLAGWERTLTELVERFAPPHLSLYSLTIEPRTVLALHIRRGRRAAPDDALQAEMMFLARDLLAARGYAHYEVSSWARPGHLAVHNSGYWEHRPCLALGAGAHGLLEGVRYRNEARPSRYIERMAAFDPEEEAERVDPATQAFERVLTGLRRVDVGVDLGADFARFAGVVAAEVERGRLVREGTRIRLSDLGLRFMDDVLLAFVL